MTRPKTSLLLLAALACAAAFAGLGWDTPSAARAARVLSPAWDRARLFDALTSGWNDIYDKSAGATPLAAEAAGKYSTHLKGEFRADFRNAPPPPELYNSYRSMLIRSRYPDEALPLSDLARMNPAKLDFRPPSFLYGGGYIYPLGAYYAALSLTGAIDRVPLRRALEAPGILGRIYLAGRALSALALLGICVLAALIAARLCPGYPPAAAAAAVLSLPSVVVYSHYLTPHLWAALWGLTSVYCALLAVPGLRLRPLLASAACLALAAGSYWSALHAAVLVFPVLFSRGAADLDKGGLKRLLYACLAGLAVFFALNPYLPFNWGSAVYEVFPGGSTPWTGPVAGTAGFLSGVMPGLAGPVMALLIPAGCLWGLFFSGSPLLRNLSAGTLVFIIPAAMSVTPDFPSGIRRFFPWLITGGLIGTVFLLRLLARLSAPWRAAALAAALAPGLVMSGVYLAGFTDASGPRSTFYRMADKLDSMPAGQTLGMTDFPQPVSMPAFRLDRWKVQLADPATLNSADYKNPPDYLLVTFDGKPALAGLLKARYDLEAGFYPRGVPGFAPDVLLCAANPPLELYKLRSGKAAKP